MRGGAGSGDGRSELGEQVAWQSMHQTPCNEETGSGLLYRKQGQVCFIGYAPAGVSEASVDESHGSHGVLAHRLQFVLVQQLPE